jgi:hypothetical protein
VSTDLANTLSRPKPPGPPAQSPPEAPFKPLPLHKLSLGHSAGADYNNIWLGKIPAGTPYEHALRPEFWSNAVSLQVNALHGLRRFDEIKLFAEDGSFYARLLVRETARSRAVVEQLEYHQFGEAPKFQDPKRYTIKFLNPSAKWGVIDETGKIIREAIESKETAEGVVKNLLNEPKRDY